MVAGTEEVTLRVRNVSFLYEMPRAVRARGPNSKKHAGWEEVRQVRGVDISHRVRLKYKPMEMTMCCPHECRDYMLDYRLLDYTAKHDMVKLDQYCGAHLHPQTMLRHESQVNKTRSRSNGAVAEHLPCNQLT